MITATLVAGVVAAGSLRPVALRCEAMEEPVAVATAVPRFSWLLQADDPAARDLRQTGYRILVASDPDALAPGKADLWDSGVVRSSATFGVEYAGKTLRTGQKCWWRVQCLDQEGRESHWSKAAAFGVGLLGAGDWKAEWVGFDAPGTRPKPASPFAGADWIWAGADAGAKTFAKSFDLPGEVASATLHATADDQFELDLNGARVAASDGQTDAWRRPVTAVVKAALRRGANTVSVKATNTGGVGALLLRLHVVLADGREVVVASDGTWTEASSPVRVIGAFGVQPWGNLGPNQLFMPPPRYVRGRFQVGKPIKRAVLHGSALGLIELHLNGARVSDELFMPGWTDYAKRVYARAYDVTDRVKQGANAIGAILGDGWYAGYVGFGSQREHYGKNIRAGVQLEIEYADGSRETVASDHSWRARTGPILESDFLMGEVYDARLELGDWCLAGASDEGWSPVDTGAEVSPLVETFIGQPVVRYDVLEPKTIKASGPDTYILDLGQNLAGFARLKVNGKPGQKITLRFAERLNTDGSFYVTNLRAARCVDTFICKGGPEVWEPKFTFHGFQFIEVTGLGRAPKPDEVVGVAISSDTPTVGTLETSDAMLNKLVSNAWWTQRMNFIDIPTDCPQRDERLGWTGDAQAYVRTATMFSDVQPFFEKWLISLDDAQRADGQYPMVAPVKVAGDDGGPAWADAGVICPWTIYDVYGDRRLLERHYPNMKRFVEFCRNRSTADLLPPAQFHCFGDWLNINAPTPHEVIYTAYFAGSARLVAQAARELGKTEDAKTYEDLYRRVRAAFQKAYVSPEGVVKGDTQCGYVLALGFDLLDDHLEGKAIERFVADIVGRGYHLSTGFVGTRDIMHVLSKIGRNDLAFRLLHNTTFPSWGFTIVNGATSIWERWDGWTPEKGFQDAGMNSFAHYAFGAVVGWMFAQPAGIGNLEPGFGRVRVAPQVDPRLTWLKSSYKSVRGTIVSEWSRSGGRLAMRVVVPPNVTAEIHVPKPSDGSAPSAPFGLRGVREESGAVVYEVGSGEYRFETSGG